MSNNKYYDEIVNMKISKNFLPVLNAWQRLSENIKNHPIDYPVIIPNMLWVAKSGIGRTKLLRLVSEYLVVQENIMEFYGEVKFFEFLFDYCSPQDEFHELERLMTEIDHAAGFRSEYKGIVCVDVDQWLHHCEEKHFISIMEYLASHSEKWLIIFSVSDTDMEAVNRLEAVITMYMRIERVEFYLPETSQLFDYVDDFMYRYGFTMRADAKKLLADSIDVLRESKYFDGFKSLQMLCSDIIYDLYTRENFDGYVITADMLADFSKDSEYIRRTIINRQKAGQIGFSFGEGAE